jgi:hypothetical protein
MKRIILFLILIAALVVGLMLYRSRSGRLNVTPDAEREIEKAKRR